MRYGDLPEAESLMRCGVCGVMRSANAAAYASYNKQKNVVCTRCGGDMLFLGCFCGSEGQHRHRARRPADRRDVGKSHHKEPVW